jgi:hypothetical protein
MVEKRELVVVWIASRSVGGGGGVMSETTGLIKDARPTVVIFRYITL